MRKVIFVKMIVVLLTAFILSGLAATPLSVFAEDAPEKKIQAFVNKYGPFYKDVDWYALARAVWHPTAIDFFEGVDTFLAFYELGKEDELFYDAYISIGKEVDAMFKDNQETVDAPEIVKRYFNEGISKNIRRKYLRDLSI